MSTRPTDTGTANRTGIGASPVTALRFVFALGIACGCRLRGWPISDSDNGGTGACARRRHLEKRA